MTRHVVIGAGEAGLRAALALRDAGETDVHLLGGEIHPTYERPALSKTGDGSGHHRTVAADCAGISLRLGVPVVRIDRAAATVEHEDGPILPYDRLLLATGARPRVLACDPEGAAWTLRTLEDANRIYGAARSDGAAVIIGAGLIGLELAAELRRRRMNVTVLEAGPRALGRGVPADVAEELVGRHWQEGVAFSFGQSISRISPGRIDLRDGSSLRADLIVAAVGVEPDTRLAESAGLVCGNGIRVDATLRTSDPAIFAAGDCVAMDHPRYGAVRFETWRSACDQGAHAARSMLGQHEPFTAIPRFWSDQYDLGLQAVGLHDPARAAVRRDLPRGGWLRFELDDEGRLSAAFGIGPGTAVAKDIRLSEMLIDRGARCEPDLLADPSFNLKAALKSA
ncbi:MAG: FAD-dependent oxidoreductase [Alsobacter sp.]